MRIELCVLIMGIVVGDEDVFVFVSVVDLMWYIMVFGVDIFEKILFVSADVATVVCVGVVYVVRFVELYVLIVYVMILFDVFVDYVSVILFVLV